MNPKYEHVDIQTPESVDVHLDEDSSLRYTIFELKDISKKGESDIKDCFESHEADEELRELAIDHYEAMLNDPKAFVGIGNTALVFKQHPKLEKNKQCVKCRWDFLMVNNKSKKIDSLPENLKRLKWVERHFEEVNAKKRSLIQKGFDSITDNGVLREAVVQHMAARILSEACMPGSVPDIDFIIKIEREESGDVGGDVFSANETVNQMFMDQIPGMNLEDMLYEASAAVAKKIDPDSIEKELKSMIAILHKEGIVHRDLSLRNIMLDSETLRPHIIDFGKSVYSERPSDSDIERDYSFLREAVRFLNKFKADPQAAREELKEMHKD